MSKRVVFLISLRQRKYGADTVVLAVGISTLQKLIENRYSLEMSYDISSAMMIFGDDNVFLLLPSYRILVGSKWRGLTWQPQTPSELLEIRQSCAWVVVIVSFPQWDHKRPEVVHFFIGYQQLNVLCLIPSMWQFVCWATISSGAGGKDWKIV